MEPITFTPIGVIHTPFEKKAGIPIQAKVGKDIEGTIVLHEHLVEGLSDLHEFSYIHLIYHFHRHSHYDLLTTPYMDDTPRGVYSTRAPKRPNPIGLSLVEIVSIKHNLIQFTGVDMLNNTPLLDIKPYFSDFDVRTDANAGWLDRVKQRREISDDRF